MSTDFEGALGIFVEDGQQRSQPVSRFALPLEAAIWLQTHFLRCMLLVPSPIMSKAVAADSCKSLTFVTDTHLTLFIRNLGRASVLKSFLAFCDSNTKSFLTVS